MDWTWCKDRKGTPRRLQVNASAAVSEDGAGVTYRAAMALHPDRGEMARSAQVPAVYQETLPTALHVQHKTPDGGVGRRAEGGPDTSVERIDSAGEGDSELAPQVNHEVGQFIGRAA